MIVESIVDAVAGNRLDGLNLREALRVVHQRLTVDQWEKALKRRPILLARYEQKLGEGKLVLARSIKGTTRSNMPTGTCWILERCFPDDFGVKSGAKQQNTQINVCIGLPDDISRRAARMVSGKTVTTIRPVKVRELSNSVDKDIQGQQTP